MARIRTIKPEFWTDYKTGTLTDKAKVLFIGILNICDDYGVTKYEVAEFSAKIFPFENFLESSRILSNIIEKEFLPRGLVVIFSQAVCDDVAAKYLWIKNFERHQKVDKPGKPLIPNWECGDNPKIYAKRLEVEIQEYDEKMVSEFGDYSRIFSTIRENSPWKGREGKRKGKGKGKGKGRKGSSSTR